MIGKKRAELEQRLSDLESRIKESTADITSIRSAFTKLCLSVESLCAVVSDLVASQRQQDLDSAKTIFITAKGLKRAQDDAVLAIDIAENMQEEIARVRDMHLELIGMLRAREASSDKLSELPSLSHETKEVN